MSQYAGVKATINANIKTNNNEEITGLILNSVLNEMVDNLAAGYLFKGVASTSTNPGSPDAKVFYLGGAGTYTHFGHPTIANGHIGVFWYDTAWHSEAIDVAPVIQIVNNFTDGGVDKALSAEMGKDLYNLLFGVETIIATKDDADAYLVQSGQVVQPPNGIRIRVILPITAGQKVRASCSMGKGVAASIYETEADCLPAGQNYLQTISYSYVNSLEGTANVSGYLCVSLSKTDDSKFTAAQMTAFLQALQLEIFTGDAEGVITSILEKQQEVEDSLRESLLLGTLLQKSLTASGLSDSAYRVSMASANVVPWEQATLEFHLPTGYAIGIRSGDQAGNLSNNDYWFYDGDTFSFAANVHYFRLCFAKPLGDTEYGTITPTEVQGHLADGTIRIYIRGNEPDIITRNGDSEKYVKSVMRNFVSGQANNGSLTKLPVFAHTSDVHGDARRFNSFMDYCDFLGVDAALLSGDAVALNPADSMQYVLDAADSHTTPVLYCQGNHDSRSLTTAQAQNEAGIGYLITKNASVTPVGETYPTYYYQDFTSKKIRVIAVNLYELSHSNDNCNFTQAQCQWLISTLASTPANYGVILMFHAPEAQPAKDNTYGAFFQDLLTYTGYQANITGSPFRQIVDAFISKTTATISYKVGNTTITASADFTGVASGVEFIAYVNGHLHADLVGYVDGATNRQLVLNVTCGVAIYGSTYYGLANLSDLPRGCKGSVQDAFNIYSIDRTAKVVRIARVGSNLSGYDLEERKFMAIPYAD